MANIITIENIEEGMVLAEPIINKFGQTLLPAGATLKTSHVRLFKTWNVRSLSVKAQTTEVEMEINEEMLELARQRILKKMKWTPRNSIENDLLKMAQFVHARTLNKS